jgi:hypothetical protein
VKVLQKSLILILSMAMLASGVLLLCAYSGQIEATEVLAQGAVTVPANGYQSIVYARSSSGNYFFQIDTETGIIQAFFNTENSTMVTWTNGTLLDMRNIPSYAVFNGSSGTFAYGLTQESPSSEYLLLSNPDSFAKEVSYRIWRSWTFENYLSLLAGISLISVATIVLFQLIFKGKLKDFNRVLESQE